MQKIIPLRDAPGASIAGGKAAALGDLLRSGVSVPDGFVVVGDPLSVEAVILSHFDRLGVPFVAVRSSALAEDGKEDAWAGQLDTYLNVSRTDLLTRIQQCAQSAHSARAKAYAEHKHIAAGQVAVLVQAMVDSEISGVAFSVHPVTKSADTMVIEAALGLGEAVVSGEITPDTYILEAADGNVKEQFISTQTKRLIRSAHSGNEWQTIDRPINGAKLNGEQLHELAEAVNRISTHYGFPVDIEWASAGGKLYILQARPITTL